MRSREVNGSGGTTLDGKKRTLTTRKVLLAADVDVATPIFTDMPQSSNDLSTRKIKQTSKLQSKKKVNTEFKEVIVTEPENDRVKLLREQDKNLVGLLSTRVETKPTSNMLIFDFEKKRENPPHFVPKQVDVGDLQAEGVEIERFKISRAGQDTLSFKRKIGDARREDPTRPALSRALAGEHCVFVRDAIMEDSTVETIIYEDDIDVSTIARFVACISPASRTVLPIHDVVEILDAGHPGLLATKIERPMDKLEDLYMFAHVMGAFDVCDMVIYRVYEELHHPQQNLRRSTIGVTAAFKLPDISPAFLNFLWRHDKKGFEFFADILVMAAEDTLELLRTSGLGSWHQQVKRTLIEKLESDTVFEVSKNNAAAICSNYHHHQGSGTRCYQSNVPETLSIIASASGELISPPPTPKKRVEPPKRVQSKHPPPTPKKQFELPKGEQSPKNCKRRKLWANSVTFQKTDHGVKKAREGVHFESSEQRKSRLQNTQQELHDDWEEYMKVFDSESLSDDEDCNAIIVRLPEVYSKARDLFRRSAGSQGEPYIYTQLFPGPKHWKKRTRNLDGLKYCDKGMNLVKDTAELQHKKVAIVKEKLQMLRDYGHVPDCGKARGRLKTTPGLASKNVEMTDEDEGGH